MKRIMAALALAACLGVVGCGKDNNPNKDLKPIDANTPPPKPAKETQGNNKSLDAPTPIIK